jgi:hypothetical protein
MTSTSSLWALNYLVFQSIDYEQGRIQDFKIGGAHLKKLRRAEGGAKIFGVFRVKNNDFTPKKSYFFQLRREARNLFGCFVWKITILRQNVFFSNFRGGGGGGRRVRPPWIRPWWVYLITVIPERHHVHYITYTFSLQWGTFTEFLSTVVAVVP